MFSCLCVCADITPVLNGAVVHKAAECIPVAGEAFTEVIHSVLSWSSKKSISKDTARDVKEKLSFVCDDPLRQKKRSGTAETYALPDGSSIVVDRLRYEASELFFGTSRGTLSKYFPQDSYFAPYDDHCVDLPSLTFSCLQEAVPDTVATESGPESRDGILRKMLVCGGTSKMQGFRERFVLEMNRLSRSTARPTLFRPISHLSHFSLDHPCYVGATIVGAMDLFHHIGVKKADYNEDGPGIAKRFVF
jgi:actin-related protein